MFLSHQKAIILIVGFCTYAVGNTVSFSLYQIRCMYGLSLAPLDIFHPLIPVLQQFENKEIHADVLNTYVLNFL